MREVRIAPSEFRVLDFRGVTNIEGVTHVGSCEDIKVYFAIFP